MPVLKIKAATAIHSACDAALKVAQGLDGLERLAEDWRGDGFFLRQEDEWREGFFVERLITAHRDLCRLFTTEVGDQLGAVHHQPVLVGGMAFYSYSQSALEVGAVWANQLESTGALEESMDPTVDNGENLSMDSVKAAALKNWPLIVGSVRDRFDPIIKNLLEVGIQKECVLATNSRPTFERSVPMTKAERDLFALLEGRNFQKEPLASELRYTDPARLYGKNGQGPLAQLMKRGLVVNRRGVGYYRPDAPPPELVPSTKTPPSDNHLLPTGKKPR